MRIATVATLFLLLGTAFTPVRAQKVESSTSAITGVQTIESTAMRDITIDTYPGNDAGFQAIYTYNPKDGLHTWGTAFYGFADKETGMANVGNMTLKVNGRTLQPLRIKTKVRNVGDTVLEVVTAYFSRSIYEQIATAESVIAEIGPAVLELPHYDRKDMRIILGKVPPSGPPQTASTDQ